jgi:hypothetical protein
MEEYKNRNSPSSDLRSSTLITAIMWGGGVDPERFYEEESPGKVTSLSGSMQELCHP